MNPIHQKILTYFQFEHLPQKLQEVSALFWNLANDLANRAEAENGADPAETTVALRKLLEAKDAAVRAAL